MEPTRGAIHAGGISLSDAMAPAAPEAAEQAQTSGTAAQRIAICLMLWILSFGDKSLKLI